MTLQEVHTPAQFTIEPGETCLTALMDTAKKRPHGVMSVSYTHLTLPTIYSV